MREELGRFVPAQRAGGFELQRRIAEGGGRDVAEQPDFAVLHQQTAQDLHAAGVAGNAATAEIMVSESLEDKFKALENEDKVELLLAEMKSRHALPRG